MTFENEAKVSAENLVEVNKRHAERQSPPPAIGQIVYYISYGTPGGEYAANYRAAIVTQVDDYSNPVSALGLCVVNPTGMFFNQHVPHGLESGHWAWPPFYVEPVE